MLWKAKHVEFKDELINKVSKNELESKYIDILGENVAILHKEVEYWNDTVNKVRQDYEETIHSLMPETFEKKWVKDIEKKVMLYGGNTFLCSLFVLLLTYFFILTYQVATCNILSVQIK